jgi:hypothetical protein
VARDITEGRSTRAIAVDIGLSTATLWQNTGVQYDFAIGGLPFLAAIDDTHPYERATAQFRKQQFDSQRDPGEQSLSNWWLRSQMSFHAGEGIVFYDPLANPYSTTIATNSYRVKDAYGVDIWTPGQVKLLRDTTQGHVTSGIIDATYGRQLQHIFSARWTNGGTFDGIILHDAYDMDRIKADGTIEHWVDYNNGTADPIFAATTDGNTMYWVTNDTKGGKLRVEKKAIAAAATSAPVTMWTAASGTVNRAAIGYVKQRLILCANESIYAFPISQSTAPTAIYTHPSTSYVYSSVAESGSAIYVSGYEGLKSSIFKLALTTTGAMETISAPITAAELPIGERVHKLFYYLGYMVIGTNKGVRVASIDTTGSLTYGPLLFEVDQPVYDFCARDKFVWCATGVDTEPGLIRINLAEQIDTLQFAYARDVHYDDYTNQVTTACGFIGDTDRVAFVTSAPSTSATGFVYMEEATKLRINGYIETGLIRYNTLEPKNFKRIIGRGIFDYGSMSVQTRSQEGVLYDLISYDSVVGSPEVTITSPAGAQDSMGLRFTLYRDATDDTKSPTFKGYQLKAVPATPRNRVIVVPLMNFDNETDKYNQTIGYEGRAIDRLAALENAEANGDIITWQDFRNREIAQCLIEEIKFTDVTPPDKRLTGYGGIITLTIRTV